MQVTCRIIEADGSLRIVDESAAIEGWRGGRDSFWIDLESKDTSAMVAWLTGLGVDPDLLAACEASDSTGSVLPLDDAVFFEYPVPAPGGDGSTVVFGCLCLERLVVTLHREPLHGTRRNILANRVRLKSPSTSDLVCGMTIAQSAGLRRAALAVRDRARELSAVMDDEPESVALDDILALKRNLLDLDRVADEQMSVFDTLQAVDKPPLDLVRLGDYFRTAITNAQAADRRLDRLQRVVVGLQQRYDSVQQDKTNKRLGLLTILSAIFMPLTLIAGIYGMNFDVMPELHFEFAYPMALGGMAIVAAALFWYFKSRGWME